jgi:DNA helicase-2/ATP-dependent DNA helicase PcrA
MSEPLWDDDARPYGLSPEQAAAVINTSNVFVRACPGSGKTRSVAARVAWMHEEQKKLALLSFTRVGADEISRATLQDHGVTIGGASFVGTVQSFLQRYVLTPFAHLVTGASMGVRIDPEQVEALDPTGVRSSDFKLGIDGSLTPGVGKRMLSAHLMDEVKKAKLNAAKQGVVGLEDDVYWSHRVLSTYPTIRNAVATRFDEIIVDEAQDLDELQIACLRLLKEDGLESLVLVGDYDQTIYQWRGSNPSLCEQLAADVGLTPAPLTENYRSSQIICDLASGFRNDPVPDKAVGTFAHCSVPPMVVLYLPGEESLLPAKLENLVQRTNISAESLAVLVRSQGTKQKVTGTTAPTVRGTAKTLLAIRQSRVGPSLAEYKEVEQLLLRRAFGTSSMSSGLDWHVVRSTSISVIDSLPALEGSLLKWAKAADAVLEAGARQLAPAVVPEQRQFSYSPEWAKVRIEQSPEALKTSVRIDTVHSFKGESIDAVMLVAGDPSPAQKRSGYGDSVSWSEHLGDPSTSQSEDVRVAYVAITRARQLIVLALPNDTDPRILNKFLAAGFVLQSA